MKKAVLIFAHKDAYLLNVLIQQLIHKSGETDVFIHLDKKAESIKEDILDHKQVHFIKNNVSVTWGDDTMMKALLNSWEEIIEQGNQYEYFIMCTGQDLLVRENLDKFLEDNKGKIWLDCRGAPQYIYNIINSYFPRWLCRDFSNKPKYHPLRIGRAFYYKAVVKGWAPKKTKSKGQKPTIYISYNWSMMPFYVMKDCLANLKSNAGLLKLYRNTLIPEDYFLGTMIMNSPYSKNVVWPDKNSWSKTPTFHYPFDVHPKILDETDIQTIESSNCLFARKFDSKKDINVINYFKNKILNS